jgi:hypothetical protein
LDEGKRSSKGGGRQYVEETKTAFDPNSSVRTSRNSIAIPLNGSGGSQFEYQGASIGMDKCR